MIQRLTGFLAGFAAVIVLIALWPRHTIAPRVLSEGEGAMKTVEIQFTKASAATNWPPIQAFLAAIDPTVHVIAVCGDAADEAELKRRLNGRAADTIVVDAPITGWSKDRFLVSEGCLVCPRSSASPLASRENDSRVAPAIARRFAAKFRVRTSDLQFDAGDILCTPSFALVNDEIVDKNPGIMNWLDLVEQMTGRKVIRLPQSPRHHIGMFAAPLDDRTVVVADPELGRKLWTQEATKSLGAPDWSEAAVSSFGEAIGELGEHGFHVVRTPAAVIAPRVYVTYTNAVFEQRDGRKIVYMPVYGVPALDEAGARAYRSQGWEVKPIPVRTVFRLCGTIGCLVNVLERA